MWKSPASCAATTTIRRDSAATAGSSYGVLLASPARETSSPSNCPEPQRLQRVKLRQELLDVSAVIVEAAQKVPAESPRSQQHPMPARWRKSQSAPAGRRDRVATGLQHAVEIDIRRRADVGRRDHPAANRHGERERRDRAVAGAERLRGCGRQRRRLEIERGIFTLALLRKSPGSFAARRQARPCATDRNSARSPIAGSRILQRAVPGLTHAALCRSQTSARA